MGFVSPTGSVEYHQKLSDHTGFDKDEINEQIFESIVHRYQVGLEIPVKGSNFVFGGADILHYGKFYLDSPQWLKT